MAVAQWCEHDNLCFNFITKPMKSGNYEGANHNIINLQTRLEDRSLHTKKKKILKSEMDESFPGIIVKILLKIEVVTEKSSQSSRKSALTRMDWRISDCPSNYSE